MKCDKKTMLLYAVTDRAWTGKQSLLEQVEAALRGRRHLRTAAGEDALRRSVPGGGPGGLPAVPALRRAAVHQRQRGGRPSSATPTASTWARRDMAAAQVRRRVGDDMMIGVSVHSVAEALDAVRDGADCLGVGAMFSTSTKADADVLPPGTAPGDLRRRGYPGWWPSAASPSTTSPSWPARAWTASPWSARIFSAPDIESECRLLRRLSEEMVNA